MYLKRITVPSNPLKFPIAYHDKLFLAPIILDKSILYSCL